MPTWHHYGPPVMSVIQGMHRDCDLGYQRHCDFL